MKKITLLLSLLCTAVLSAQSVFINEIHYDNAGVDAGEFVEIAGPAGTDLSTYDIVLYNGSNGTEYNTVDLSGSLDDEGAGFGAQSFAISGIQNGGPDGIALLNGATVVQFISYEGDFMATNGPAMGMMSTDIGVSEPSNTPIGQSLQLTGTGSVYTDFTWNAPAAESPGSINAGQTFVAPIIACDITCPGNITATADPMATTAIVTYADPTLSGDCTMAGFTQTAGLPSGSNFPLGTTTNTFEATDANDGTVVTCSFSVTVNESTAPTAECMDIDLELDDMGMATITPEDVSPIALINGYELDQDGTFAPMDISGTGNNVALGDDQLSGALPVGFSFSFFGNDYTDFYISSNGFITFDPATGQGCCSGRVIPSADGRDDIIALAWEDLNPPSGGTIRYETLGTAPNRMLVVEFFEVNHFGTPNPVTAQAILYEGSNKIELHTTTLNTGSGLHTQGIENADGTQAVAVEGRVAVDFSLTNDFVSFTPLTITATPDTFDCSTTGDQMVTVTVTGDDGQSASCVSTVNVIPNVDFTGCPVDIFVATGNTTNCGVVVDYTTPTGTSVCGTPTITQTAGPASGSTFPVGETLVEFTADVNGSTAVCSFVVTVIDSAFPELDCPGDLIVSGDDNGNYEIEDYTAATDNCTAAGNIVTTQEPAAGTVVTEGSTTTVTVTATDEAGNTTNCTFDILVDSTLSVSDQVFSNAISLYPNPTSNVVTLENSSAAIINKIEVVDVNGRVLSSSNTEVSRETQIDFSSYATGVYFVQIIAGNTSTVKRIVKQ
ncbi:HYR domain-containing protein [Dokdonia sinensis]|uniref:HYR domain-containing protein n=1 Tax=Dokdonia sinensis TaxID=2479847 RepID=A0A3M0FVS4_9FLAO|nr:HYR domain-containing protein [Dokdonia sinensis]RMB56781.1 HYR domain-containing protein [Dokdonia sinensis]